MITIGPIGIPLPPFLTSLPQPLVWALAALFTSWLIALLLRFILLRFLRYLALRSEGEWEDVLIEVSQGPLLLAVLIAGVIAFIQALGVQEPLSAGIQRWLVAGLMAVGAYWIWKVLKEVVIHYGERLALRSETRLDDILLPIVNQFAPLAIFIIGGGVILQHLGVHLDALLVAIGGAAFILAFALQDILSNVFSGISLLVDTPFRYGDLVTLEDGSVCQVQKIGVRVTQLYDIYDHAVIYMPNNKLANERLTNLMQPTPELFSTVHLALARDADVEQVLTTVNDVLDGHPDLLGSIPAKVQAIPTFELLSREKRRHGVERLSAELRVDEVLQQCSAELEAFAEDIRLREKGGLNRSERSALLDRSLPLLETLGVLPDLEARLDRFQSSTAQFLDNVHHELGAQSLAAAVWAWVNLWAQDPDLERGVDDERLRRVWATKTLSLLRRVEELKQRIKRTDTLELRLDNSALDLERWLRSEFKQPIPPWKCSGTSFKGFQDGALVFHAYFLVDNIELEHFFRRARVEAEVHREIVRRFRERGFVFASPRHDVALHTSESIPFPEPTAQDP